MTMFIAPLTTVTLNDGPHVGAKAVSVARLAAAGVCTPQGWCLTVDAYRATVARNVLFREAIAELDTVDLEDLLDVTKPAAKIRHAVLEAELPEAVRADIADAFTYLGDIPLAVRSSATSEDLALTAAAGQHDTFLGVRGFDDLVVAIRRCWASLWSARAVVYRSRFGIPLEAEMAVLVQELITSDVSGVLFTLNPLSPAPTDLLVTSAPGRGEDVVSGSVEVDTVLVDRKTFQARRSAPASVAENVASRSTAPPLPDTKLSEVCRVGLLAEAVFGVPLDIEWTFDGDRLVLLQARPITAATLETGTRKLGYARRLALRMLLEYFPVPIYHFDRAYIAPLLETVFGLVSEFGLRPPATSDLFIEYADGSLGPGSRLPKPTAAAIVAIFRLPRTAWRGARLDPVAAVRASRAAISARAAELRGVSLASADDRKVLHVVSESQELLASAFESRRSFFIGAWCLTFLLGALLRILFGRRAAEMAADLRAGLRHPTAMMNDELRALAHDLERQPALIEIVRQNPPDDAWVRLKSLPAATAFVDAVTHFAQKYGCRTELPVPLPTARQWADDPFHVLRVLGRWDSAESGAVPVGQEPSAREGVAFFRAYRESIRRARTYRLVGCDRVLRLLVRRNRSLWIERDSAIFAYEQAVAPASAALRELGTRLVSSGHLRAWNDVRHLTVQEVSDAFVGASSPDEIQALVARRRAGRSTTVQNWSRAISEVIKRPRAGLLLKGMAASPGMAVGPASLVLSDRDLEAVRPGGILVCRSTGPSWTPLFGIVAGVVTDLGGPLSHAAIVAREYGIPAVIGTGNATSTLRPNRIYTVDGFAGEVRMGGRTS